MSQPEPMFIMDRGFSSSYDRSIAGKVAATLEKLQRDPTSPGLHVEPLNSCADDRVRSARVDQFHRMIFFDLDSALLLYGVYGHDKAYQVAANVYARVNPVSGTAEIREAQPRGEAAAVVDDAEVNSRAQALVAEELARQQFEAEQRAEAQRRQGDEAGSEPSSSAAVQTPQPSPEPAPAPEANPLADLDVSALIDELGIDESVAHAVVAAEDTDRLLRYLEGVTGWQSEALMELATGATLEETKASFTLGPTDLGTPLGQPSTTEAVLQAATDYRAANQFHLIEDDEALAKVLATGDFEAWRLFLHPEQREHVDRTTRGPFRLSGGAGTGKTVVLVHRAVRLAQRHPGARVLVVSFTTNLVDMLREQIRSLDPTVHIASQLGEPGICVLTLDQVARRVLSDAESSRRLDQGMSEVLGWGVRHVTGYRGTGGYGANPWESAIDEAGDDLPDTLRSVPFFVSEYQEIVLPQQITDEISYLRAPRTGRGSGLGRKQRRAVWEVIHQYRRTGLAEQRMDFDEATAVAAHLLSSEGGSPQADHLLIDEGQDFTPTRWQLARALVAEGDDDLFIAEDSNQRIYGNRLVLSHYGIKIVGRSRRLRLNYRTTEQNLELALKVLDGGAYDEDDIEADEGASTGTGRYVSRRVGPVPQLHGSESLAKQYDEAARLLSVWLQEITADGLPANSLGVLVRTKRLRDQFAQAMGERGVSVHPVDGRDAAPASPVVMTLHRAKGTEFTRVLIFGVSEDAIPRSLRGQDYDADAKEQGDLRERSLLYVGATRARDMLAISWNGKASPYLPRP